MLDPDELAYGRDLILACAAGFTHWTGPAAMVSPNDAIFSSRTLEIEHGTLSISPRILPWLSVKEDG